MRRAGFSGLVAASLVLLARLTHADLPPLPPNPQILDPYDIPLAPRPPTLPELTHHDYEVSGETTFGVITPNVLKALEVSSSDVAVLVQRLAAEAPLDRRRRFYLGGSYEMAAGSPPGGGSFKLVPSNLDVYGRVVWATRTGLTFGGGLGVLLPTAQFGNGDAAKVAAGAQAIRPWDNAFFLDDTTTFRAFVDVRDVDGRFTLQFREGLEWSINLGGGEPQVAAIAQVFAGFRVLPLLGIGLEAFETYLIVLDTPPPVTTTEDKNRATFTISPNVRLMTPYVQPELGFVTSIGDPLFGGGAVDGFWALRVGASIVWDPSMKALRRGDASAR
jgi:hypothetical protein